MPLAMRLSRFGVGNLRLEQLSSETVGPGMVRVAFAAVSLNHRDLLVIRGALWPRFAAAADPVQRRGRRGRRGR